MLAGFPTEYPHEKWLRGAEGEHVPLADEIMEMIISGANCTELVVKDGVEDSL